MSNRHVRQQGFTLVELMIAITMLSIVIVGALESFTRQHRTSIVTENVVEVQQNVRAIASLMEREIRMAGFMVPNAVSICGIDVTDGADQLFISETEPIVPDDERAGDLGARLAATQSWNPATTSGTLSLNLDSNTTDLDRDGAFFYDNDNNNTNEADFRVGGGFILGDMANPHRGAVCGTVGAASNTLITITVLGGQLAPLTPATDADEEIVIVPAAHYAINTNPGTGRFERNGQLLAQGVDDFQISFFFDVNDDGVIAPSPPTAGVDEEEPGTATTLVYNAANQDNSQLKEVRFSIVVRTRAVDPDFNLGAFVNFENRAEIAGNDNFRRRSIVAAVRPRNIGIAGSI